MAIRDADPGIPMPPEVFLAGVNDVIEVIEQPASGHGYVAFAQAQRENKPELREMSHTEQAKEIARLWKQLDPLEKWRYRATRPEVVDAGEKDRLKRSKKK
jgi:hypothetical protein